MTFNGFPTYCENQVQFYCLQSPTQCGPALALNLMTFYFSVCTPLHLPLGPPRWSWRTPTVPSSQGFSCCSFSLQCSSSRTCMTCFLTSFSHCSPSREAFCDYAVYISVTPPCHSLFPYIFSQYQLSLSDILLYIKLMLFEVFVLNYTSSHYEN